MKDNIKKIFNNMSVLALLLAILVGGLIIFLCGYNPFEAFGAIMIGAFGSTRAIAQTFIQATPLIFTGLAFTAAKKASLINLGIEGQLQMGAMMAAVIGIMPVGLPGGIWIIIALAGAAMAGALYAGLVGFLKVRFNSNEVIATIMLNTVALNVVSYLVNYPLKAEGSLAQSEKIAEVLFLPRIFPKYQLTIAIFIAILACFLFKYFQEKTVLGYEIGCVGLNIQAAKTAGIPVGRMMIIAMGISGAIAGIAGGCLVLGVNHRFVDGFSPGYGFDGIAVAALASDKPAGVIVAGIVFGALRAGSMYLNRTTNVPTEFINVIQACVIIFVAAPLLVKEILRRKNGKGACA